MLSSSVKSEEESCSRKNLRLFGTSGIRGRANVEITPEMAAKLGVTFASFLGNRGTVAVGRDVRLPARPVQYAFISGVLAGGVNVEDCGVAPTPAVLWTVKERGLDGAAVVTGSHTPPEIIGLLFFMRDTAEFSVEESVEFEKVFWGRAKTVAWNDVGKLYEVDALDLYTRSVLKCVDLRKIASSSFKVVMDPGNGASALLCDKILHAAGVKVVLINGDVDVLCPNRDPYPRPEVLGELGRRVVADRADIGSATDTDGDRAIFVDGEGNVLWGDVSGCVFVRDVLRRHGSGVIVAPINTSRLINWACEVYNGKMEYTKIGPPNIVSALKRSKAVFGLEETGKNIWPGTILYGDWLLATLRMLEILAEEQKSLSELVQEFPRFHMSKEAIRCPETSKNRVMLNALRELEKRKEDAEVVTIDGIKITYSDGSWLLLRPSGTEPVFRVYAESQDLRRMHELIKMGSELVKKSLSVCSGESNLN